MIRFFKKCFFILLLILHQSFIFSAIFYADPNSGSISNPGTQSQPFSTLEDIVVSGKIKTLRPGEYPFHSDTGTFSDKNINGPIQSGDTIKLMTGHHGDHIDLQEFYMSNWLTIEAEQGESPQIGQMTIRAASYIKIMGLTISPSFTNPYDNKHFMINANTHNYFGDNHNIWIENCTLFSDMLTDGWTKDDWNTKSAHGIFAEHTAGRFLTVKNCRMYNVDFGVCCGWEYCHIENNWIENFIGDGFDGLNHHGYFVDNMVKNCYDVNGNHDDGFQTWQNALFPQGIHNITIKRNYFISWEDKNQPFQSIGFMGIGLHDGWLEDFVIEDNLVFHDDYLGIDAHGIRFSTIKHNTVVGPHSFIRLCEDNGSGVDSHDVVTSNNIADKVTHGENDSACSVDNEGCPSPSCSYVNNLVGARTPNFNNFFPSTSLADNIDARYVFRLKYDNSGVMNF